MLAGREYEKSAGGRDLSVCDCCQRRNPDSFEECEICGLDGCSECLTLRVFGTDPFGHQDSEWRCGAHVDSTAGQSDVDEDLWADAEEPFAGNI